MSSKTTANQIIYFINHSPELLKIWRELDERSKRLVIEDCELTEECNFERVIKEVADGQRRLF